MCMYVGRGFRDVLQGFVLEDNSVLVPSNSFSSNLKLTKKKKKEKKGSWTNKIDQQGKKI